MSLWHVFLYQPLVNALIFLYQILGRNLGWAIIGLTVAIRSALIPLTSPSLKAAKKMRQLAPELEKLKKQYKSDRQGLAQAQLKLYRKYGVNPTAGCLPQIIQLIVLLALFQAFNQVLLSDGPEVIEKLNQVLYPSLQLAEGVKINNRFLYLDLTKPDLVPLPFSFKVFNFEINKIPGIFLIASSATQFLASKLMMPAAVATQVKAKKTKEQEDDMAAMMQKQMLFLMPLMTFFIGLRFASGLVLYWLTFSLFMLGQQLLAKNKNGQSKKKD